jgi:predicted Zn-ribbon and HTH transcriptional regulator
LLPVCPSCGTVLTGTKIYCPSCKSSNVAISSNSHNNGGSQWETTVFKPVSRAVENFEGIRIPMSCRECGMTWIVQPALADTTEEAAGSTSEED